MTNPLARCRQSGSFIAGLLIGLAIVVAAFAVTDADDSAGQAFLVFGTPVVLVLGLALQVLVFDESRQRVAYGVNRRDLLSRPKVYPQIERWLGASG